MMTTCPLRPWTTQQLWPPACRCRVRRCCAPSWYSTGTQSFRMMMCAAKPALESSTPRLWAEAE
eukprot:8664894-Lingulodinium_polyedra.AAC.1